MRYSKRHKFILISNWKCGCSTIAHFFQPYSEFGYDDQDKCKSRLKIPYNRIVHWPAYKVRAVLRRRENITNWDDYITITTVRNPWARIVSMFFYIYKYTRDSETLKTRSHEQIKSDFTRFVTNELPKYKNGQRNRWTTEQMIFDPRTKKRLVKYIVRLEHLQEDLEPIRLRHFPEFQPFNYDTKRNTTKHHHYSTYYNPKTRAIVKQMFLWDIRKFNYRFEKQSTQTTNEQNIDKSYIEDQTCQKSTLNQSSSSDETLESLTTSDLSKPSSPPIESSQSSS